MDAMSESDSGLLAAARHGDEIAFLALYRHYRTPLFRFAWRLTGSVATAEDVLQECFLALLEGARFDVDRGSLRAYLFGIARNLALKRMRLSERESEELEDTAADLDPLEDLLSAERSEVVARAVLALEARGLAMRDILTAGSVRNVCSTRSITSFCTASIFSIRLTTSSAMSSTPWTRRIFAWR